MDLVLKLRELRKMRGLSQKDAARLSGLGEKTISSFETGNRIDSLKLSQLERLLKAYGVSESDFFGEEIEMLIAPWDEDDDIRKAREIFRRLEELTGTVRSAVLTKMQVMLETAEEVEAIATAPRPYANEHQEWQMLTSQN